MKKNKLKVLFTDIETSPLLSYTWGLFDQTIGLNMVNKEWHVLSWCAKWLGNKNLMYADQRGKKNIEDDKQILLKLWKLLDSADVVIGHNLKKFDVKKLNARFLMHGIQPPSSYRVIDTLTISKKYFAMTSNKLEYLTDKLCTKYKKTKSKKFSGFDLWKACLSGNQAAWKEMERYNKFDVLSLEELFNKLIPWDNSINFNVYHDALNNICKCGSTEFRNKGYRYTNAGKYARYRCKQCGAETTGKENLLTKEKRKSMRK